MIKKKEIKLEEFLIKIKDRLLTCNRCGHVWIQKNPDKKPKNCSKCNSPYYDKLRQVDIKKLMITKGIEF